MNVFTLNIPPTSNLRTLVYNVKIKEYNNLYTTVFVGKVFVGANQSVVRIDLEDILWNYKFDGENYDIEQVRSDINNHLSIAEAMSISSFFLTYRKTLSIRFLLYTRKQTLKAPLTKEQKKKVKKEFRKLIITTFRGV